MLSIPNRTTVGRWMDTWLTEYTGSVKPSTKAAYESCVRLYIKPALGAVKLAALQPHMVQEYIILYYSSEETAT